MTLRMVVKPDTVRFPMFGWIQVFALELQNGQ